MQRVLGEGQYDGEIIRSAQLDGAVISATRYIAGVSNCDWHCHENAHVAFVFHGAHSEGQSRSCLPGTHGIYFYPAGERHRWISPGAVSESANIELGSSYLRETGLDASDLGLAIRENPDARFLILKILKEILVGDGAGLDSARCLLLELLGGPQPGGQRGAPLWASSLSDLLNDRWDQTLSLGELSLELDLHPVTISKGFRKHFGCTLGEYTRKLKIERSLALVTDPRLSLVEVAMACGFADQSHFSRVFKLVTGFTPGAFRRLGACRA